MSLNQKTLDALKQTIESRRAALLAEIEAGVARSRSESYGKLAGEVTDRGDESVADLMVDIGNAEVARDTQELHALDAALKRLASGGYGQCADCSRDIGVERLRASPGASRCIECQRAAEQRLAHPSEPRL